MGPVSEGGTLVNERYVPVSEWVDSISGRCEEGSLRICC